MLVIRQHQLQDETGWGLAQQVSKGKYLREGSCDTHFYIPIPVLSLKGKE